VWLTTPTSFLPSSSIYLGFSLLVHLPSTNTSIAAFFPVSLLAFFPPKSCYLFTILYICLSRHLKKKCFVCLFFFLSGLLELGSEHLSLTLFTFYIFFRQVGMLQPELAKGTIGNGRKGTGRHFTTVRTNESPCPGISFGPSSSHTFLASLQPCNY
jgi:hypothetical protein